MVSDGGGAVGAGAIRRHPGPSALIRRRRWAAAALRGCSAAGGGGGAAFRVRFAVMGEGRGWACPPGPGTCG